MNKEKKTNQQIRDAVDLAKMHCENCLSELHQIVDDLDEIIEKEE